MPGKRPGPDPMSPKKVSRHSIRKPQAASPNLPAFCDFSCPHASFAEASSVGACRREQGIYCTLFRSYNNKNSTCISRK
jgi:hypothetical protein